MTTSAGAAALPKDVDDNQQVPSSGKEEAAQGFGSGGVDLVVALKALTKNNFVVQHDTESAHAAEAFDLNMHKANAQNVLPGVVSALMGAISEVSGRFFLLRMCRRCPIQSSLFPAQLRRQDKEAFTLFETAMRNEWTAVSETLGKIGTAQAAKRPWSMVMPMLYDAGTKSMGIMCKSVSEHMPHRTCSMNVP